MPNVIYFPQNAKAFAKIDVFFDAVIKPAFIAILEKHNLSTGIPLSPEKNVHARTTVFSEYEISFFIKMEKEIQFEYNNIESSIFADYHKKFADAHSVPEGHFTVPSYSLPK
jgi:hypothetical protein